jgi:hypothetical protein
LRLAGTDCIINPLYYIKKEAPESSLKRLSGAKEGIKGIERGQYLLSAKTFQNFSHKKTREHLGNLVETQKEGLAGQQGLNSPPQIQ